MLIEFNVQNYKSIAESQKLSMVAGAGASRLDRYSIPTDNPMVPRVLRSACIFGPNASGKSNMIDAMQFFSAFVSNSAKGMTDGDKINLSPFLLSKELESSPTEFEISFVYEKVMYQYGFSADRKRVLEEWMHARSNGGKSRTRTVFERSFDYELEDYEWYINKSYFEAGHRTQKVWLESTRDNALFFSTAVMLNCEELNNPFEWVKKHFRVIPSTERLTGQYSRKSCLDQNFKDKILKFIRSADLNISGISVEEAEEDLPKEISDLFREDALKLIKEGQQRKHYNVKTRHLDDDGNEVLFDLENESSGTQLLFNLAGPWIDVLSNGYTLVVDELNNSLHPIALKFLVEAFNSPESNSSGAQLIFTSHETSIVSKDFLHKDQIWFVEKADSGRSNFYPLSDFSIRDTEAFQRAYLGGRYGALPKVKRLQRAAN